MMNRISSTRVSLPIGGNSLMATKLLFVEFHYLAPDLRSTRALRRVPYRYQRSFNAN